MITTDRQLVQEVIHIAKKMGAKQVTVAVGRANSFQVEIREGQIDLLKESGSAGIHISLCSRYRRSALSSNDLRLKTLEPMMRTTMAALPYMGEDPDYTLPAPELQGCYPADLGLEDPNYHQHTSQEKIQKTLELEKQVLALDSRLRPEQAYYSDTLSHSVYGDSNGFLAGTSKTLYNLGVSVCIDDQGNQGENTARKQTDGWYSSSRWYQALDAIAAIAEQACKRVLRKLGAVKPESQEVPVIFSAEMARSFLGNLASALMGDNIYRKQSFLAEQLNTAIANTQIQLRDEPLLYGKLGSRYFDSEGVQARPLTLIEAGVLKNFMLSTYAANKLKATSTGHASGISNLVLTPGTYTEEELIASVDHGLYLTFMSGQGANITNGDYSRGAQGLWIRQGQLAEAVSEFTIASTFQDMLKQMSMIGCEVDDRSAILSPAFRIDNMAVSGA